MEQKERESPAGILNRLEKVNFDSKGDVRFDETDSEAASQRDDQQHLEGSPQGPKKVARSQGKKEADARTSSGGSQKGSATSKSKGKGKSKSPPSISKNAKKGVVEFPNTFVGRARAGQIENPQYFFVLSATRVLTLSFHQRQVSVGGDSSLTIFDLDDMSSESSQGGGETGKQKKRPAKAAAIL